MDSFNGVNDDGNKKPRDILEELSNDTTSMIPFSVGIGAVDSDARGMCVSLMHMYSILPQSRTVPFMVDQGQKRFRLELYADDEPSRAKSDAIEPARLLKELEFSIPEGLPEAANASLTLSVDMDLVMTATFEVADQVFTETFSIASEKE